MNQRWSRHNSLSEEQCNHLKQRLYRLLADQRGLAVNKIYQTLTAVGLRKSDPRLAVVIDRLDSHICDSGDDATALGYINEAEFMYCISDNSDIIIQAFKNDLIIPEWPRFSSHINDLYLKCKTITSGKPADYIPQLARYNPNYWGVGICSIDGQRLSCGDTSINFCLQSASKPLNYALVLNDLSSEIVHKHVGREPSGRSFNELSLNANNQPHNPLINAGAITVCSLLKTTDCMADRFDYVFSQYRRMAGGEHIGFNNSVFLSERDTADRNFALAYYMQEMKVFPPEANLRQTLDLYFQLCSVELNCDSASVIAATLANGGICPITNDVILTPSAVRNTLSLMHSCGMYDYSGQFAFKVGLPGKSGVSGIILLVVPNVMGVALWSPPLDELGNSVRGINFCEEFVKLFNFHNYDSLKHTALKFDPRRREIESQSTVVVNLLFGAAHGDVSGLRRFFLQGFNMAESDYDGRTALHLGATEGHIDVVRFLLDDCKVPAAPKDRWSYTPLDDARRFNKTDVAAYLETIYVSNHISVAKNILLMGHD